jgi:hypothetical protein
VEGYILDALYRRTQVVDKYESFIWTERYAAAGDFQLKLHSTPENRRRFPAGTKLALDESQRIMTVETVEDTTDEEGRKVLTLTGRSLEIALDDKTVSPTVFPENAMPKIALEGLPAAVLRKLFNDICILGTQDVGDKLPGVKMGRGSFPEDTIPEPIEPIQIELDMDTLYNITKAFCEAYDLGFRLVRNYDTTQLWYDVYSGSDRTASQTTLAPVIFSPDLDNLQNTKSLTSIALVKNVAYVASPRGHEIVWAQDVDTRTTGFERKMLLVKADSITDEDPEVASAKMIQKGREELAKYRSFAAFDGELNQNSKYKYGRDYNLGDLVELRNVDGATNRMRVTEQIFISDTQGDRSYPTLSLNKYISTGSWLAWDQNQTWEDAGPTEYWSNA